jgi:hypothetical protein
MIKANFKYRLDEFKKETEHLITKATVSQYLFVSSHEEVKLLLQIIWASLFATINVVLQ